jgi:hypothetical protein
VEKVKTVKSNASPMIRMARSLPWAHLLEQAGYYMQFLVIFPLREFGQRES